MSGTVDLSPEQSRALFDILTHRETYKEIEDFKFPGAIHHYGPPFQHDVTVTQSPILQALLAKFVLKLPGLKNVSPMFWKDRIAKLIEDLAEAELSESYDKGILGIRKTLATAISALLEYPARGCMGGFPQATPDPSRKYDLRNPDDVLQAWRDGVQEAVYGDLIDRLFVKTAETDDLGEHTPMVQCMHEFILINLASLMHYTLILSPEGPTILRMIENINRLVPYVVIRQTLKIGNVATMISGLVRVVLAKVSVGSVTNWLGLSSGADEGMNLMQSIISQVLYWDKRELRKRAEKIAKDHHDPPPSEVLDELKDWMHRSRQEHEECRKRSKEQDMSIIAVILALSPKSSDITEAQHAKALEWLQLQLGVRDREEIVRILCHRNPDLLTEAVRDAVDAYTPIIRQVHEAVNLSDSLWDAERFITDMLKTSKSSGVKGEEKPPSVGDYVELLHRHQGSLHKFLHQIVKNGHEVSKWWHDWATMAVAQFRNDQEPPSSECIVPKSAATGGAQKTMEEAFGALSASEQSAVKAELDAHRRYVEDLQAASAARISAVITKSESIPFGPGAYLARWQTLLDDTLITPGTLDGPVRSGKNKSVKEETRKDVDGVNTGLIAEGAADKALSENQPQPANTDKTWELLGSRFREALAGG